jgi:SAM-dependent methyltransferase
MPRKTIAIDNPAVQVEVDVDPATLCELIAHVRRCWEFMGQHRPYHSVLTVPTFLPEAFKGNEGAFWASGYSDAQVLERMLARHGVQSTKNLTCIDFGCGVGRVTGPLAERFAAVHGYDISAPHLEIARRRTSKAEFHLARSLPMALVLADVFYSRIVLQHNPPPIIALLIKSALECLKPGGLAVFQVPTYAVGYSFTAKSYIRRRGSSMDMEMHCLPQHHIFKIVAKTGCRLLEVREDDAGGHYDANISNVFVIQRC